GSLGHGDDRHQECRRWRRARWRSPGQGCEPSHGTMTWALPSPLRRARIARHGVAAAQPKPTAAAATVGSAKPAPVPTVRDWVGVLAMVVGLFMAIMDVQIVTSSLTQIQGGLSASTDEISWVQTAYLIADVV